MQQEAQGGWKYEWLLNKKARWPVQQLFSRRQQHKLRRWLRHAKNLSAVEEERVYICEPEVGRNLNDEGSYFHKGNEMRPVRDLIDC